MKKLLSLILLGLCLSTNILGQITKRVLFLGNSYTYVNNLPQVIGSIAKASGDSLYFDSNTPGGYTFQQHVTNSTSIAKIVQGNWDFVVLQEQSQFPSFPLSQVETDVFPYAKLLDSTINANNICAETVFYMTWGRKNGDSSNCASWPPVCTYLGMDSLLSLRYRMMADSNHALLSPVGAVWKYIRQNYPTMELYNLDQSHPSTIGTYAAACCFYTTLYRKNPLLISYNFGLPGVDATNVRTAVKSVLYDNMQKWNIGKFDAKAEFSFSKISNSKFRFTNTSKNASHYYWNFGDGDTSTNPNPDHTFSGSGNYIVTLIAYECNFSDTTHQIVNITPNGIANGIEQKLINFFPNPISETLFIDLENYAIEDIAITDAIGRKCFPKISREIKTMRIDFSQLPNGIYFVSLKGASQIVTKKIIKQ